MKASGLRSRVRRGSDLGGLAPRPGRGLGHHHGLRVAGGVLIAADRGAGPVAGTGDRRELRRRRGGGVRRQAWRECPGPFPVGLGGDERLQVPRPAVLVVADRHAVPRAAAGNAVDLGIRLRRSARRQHQGNAAGPAAVGLGGDHRLDLPPGGLVVAAGGARSRRPCRRSRTARRCGPRGCWRAAGPPWPGDGRAPAPPSAPTRPGAAGMMKMSAPTAPLTAARTLYASTDSTGMAFPPRLGRPSRQD